MFDFEKTYAKAKNGDANAQNLLGERFINGEKNEINEDEAIEWFNLAMKKGNVRGTYNLGLIYYNRNSSLEDRIIAFKCFETAALQNCYRSQHFLACYYYNGIGVPTSYSIAYFWITISRTTVENDISNNNGKHYKKTRKEIRQSFRIMEEKMKSTIGPEKIIDIQKTIKNEFFDYKKMKFKLKPDNVKAEIRYL